MKKPTTSLVLIFLFLGIAQAHEFWLLPQKFRFNTGDKMILNFMVGENFEGEYWDLNRHKVEKLKVINRMTATDLSSAVKNVPGKHVEYTFNNVGTHLVAMESDNAYIELDPQAFAAYLEEDGLEYVKEERVKRGEENSKSRERYRRFAKLLVQVGERADETYKKSAEQLLEIMPLKNPYELATGDYMTCRILYQGSPEPHVLVKVWSHLGNRTFLQNIYSESDGTITFPISNNGPWMVSSVKMVRANEAGAEWQSLWSSLVFEIK